VRGPSVRADLGPEVLEKVRVAARPQQPPQAAADVREHHHLSAADRHERAGLVRALGRGPRQRRAGTGGGVEDNLAVK
jgi:hypothetical protein